ncbi:hypothetical protein [Cellulomonas biazotea]|uniref:AbiEi antitoxin C-terminal domain-containing protein n=1 Tax=Cellulomonas biazotea TaxID=1709 RepID=A0A402DNE2_9CELL|nr:hypothetical protein [Cellulomonas biazotea]GCE75640.1 hypothetical protein CBZ_06960 [Cellulomonas biazotea]
MTSQRGTILSSVDRFWTADDLRGARSTRHRLLAFLAATGELKRVHPGLYWRGRSTPLGFSAPTPEQITSALLGATPGVGPAGASAAHALRLSTQVPRVALVAVPRRAPTSVVGVRFVARAARTGRVDQGLAAVEVAVLEVLEAWHDVVEVSDGEATSALRVLLMSARADPGRLAAAATTEPREVRARLAELLRSVGHEALAAAIPTG